MVSQLNSHLFIGTVRHRRFSPVKHSLNYTLFSPCIDLDELAKVQERIWGLGDKWWHWARIKRSDYVGKTGDWKSAVHQKIYEITGDEVNGKVLAVVQLRYMGIYFSPVNFYYVFDAQQNWKYLLAEVSNTPWNERHYYVVPANQKRWVHNKAFHVSPFNPINQSYLWRIKPLTKQLFIHLECYENDKVFDATMVMKEIPLSSRALIAQLIKTPVMAVKMVIGIYWNALKLWCKGAPFYSHPKYNSEPIKNNSEENR